MDKNNIDIVIYHDKCYDGFGCAFIVYYYYKKFDKNIKFIPANYDREINIEELKNKNILMCDFSFKYDYLIKIIENASNFLILDHHKSSEKNLIEIPDQYKIFDSSLSGIGLTWNYFFDNELPSFLAYLQDRDLWNYNLPHTLEFITFFHQQIMDFSFWEQYLNQKNVYEAIKIGSQWLSYQQKIIDNIDYYYCINDFDKLYIVAYCNSPILKSDIGNKLLNEITDFSCIWHYQNDKTYYSLRSTENKIDVSKIAEKYNGGGHRNASGIIINGYHQFQKENEYGIIKLLQEKITGKFNFMGKLNSFTLFKVKEIKNEWLDEKYFNLIKRKSNTIYIVFEITSDIISIINDTIINKKDYHIFFNEYSIEDKEKFLEYNVCSDKSRFILISSEKEFIDIFI